MVVESRLVNELNALGGQFQLVVNPQVNFLGPDPIQVAPGNPNRYALLVCQTGGNAAVLMPVRPNGANLGFPMLTSGEALYFDFRKYSVLVTSPWWFMAGNACPLIVYEILLIP